MSEIIELPLNIQPKARMECLVADFLTGHGLKLIEQHFICQYGEIDLVMRSEGILVFIDVTYRSQRHPLQTSPQDMRPAKKHRLMEAIQEYRRWRHVTHAEGRIDLIQVLGSAEQPKKIQWIKNAIALE